MIMINNNYDVLYFFYRKIYVTIKKKFVIYGEHLESIIMHAYYNRMETNIFERILFDIDR